MRKTTWKFRSFISVFTLLSLAACTSAGKKTGAENLAAELESTHEGIETIAILGTNDVHGALAIETEKTREAGDLSPVEYHRGGVSVIASYVKALRKSFGNRLLWLDGGDEFQGSVESNMEKGKGMVRFFNLTGLDGAAIGNHEFDFGPEDEAHDHDGHAEAHEAAHVPATPASEQASVAAFVDRLGALKARMREAHFSYLAANVMSKATGELAAFPNTLPSKIYNTGRIKVGVVGLSTLDTPKTTLAINVESLYFADLKEATIREARKLREAGADVVVITSHVGLKCETGRVNPGLMIRRQTDPQGECGSDDEMVKLLRSLPSGTVDAVVSGHSHQIVHHWIAGVPVIQGGSFGRYFNVIYLNYDLKARKVIPEKTKIEGPIPVCTQVFKNQSDCNGDRPAPKNGRGPLVQVYYHGHKIEADSDVEKMLEPVLARAAALKSQKVGLAARPIEHERGKESPLGNLVSDAIRKASGANIALMNAGGIRAPLDQGQLTFGQVFRALPFDNSITTLQVTGKELLQILRIAESGSRGFTPVSGVKMRVIGPDYDAPSSDLDGDKAIEPWEVNRLLDARLDDGSPIREDKTYLLATVDFLVSGGDDVGWALKKIPLSRVHSSDRLIRNTVLQYIRELSAAQPDGINSGDKPLVDPSHPRLVFEKPKEKKGHGKGKRSKKRRRSLSHG